MPAITWKGCHGNNYTIGRNTKVIGLVLHVAEGTKEATNNWFHNPTSQASTNYLIGKQGEIWQFVRDEDTAYGNGILEQPDTSVAFIKQIVDKELWANAATISIENEGLHTEKQTEAQYQAMLWLVRKLCEKYSIPKNSDGIAGHFQIQKFGRANCPGSMVDWKRLFMDLAKPAGGDPITKPLKPIYSPNTDNYNVGSGMLEKLKELQDIAGTNEQWYSPQPNQPGLFDRSFLYTKTPGRLLIAYKQEDGTWDVRSYREE